jgi:type VI secretion system protein ImpB
MLIDFSEASSVATNNDLKGEQPMRESFQNEIPPSRINIRYVNQADGQEAIELPLRLLVLGDYTQREPDPDDPPLEQMRPISIKQSDEFASVMQEMNLGLDLTVDNKLDDQGGKMKVNLKFPDLDAFNPESIAQQVPELKALLTVRHLLNDLKNYVITNTQLQKELNKIVSNESDFQSLVQKLEELVSMPGSSSESES